MYVDIRKSMGSFFHFFVFDFSPIKRLYSVVTIIEDEKQLKSVVYWPPKDKKQINYYISNWVSPDKGWGEYILLKINLDKGTKEMCDVCMKFDSESSNSDFQGTGILVNLTHMLLHFKIFF